MATENPSDVIAPQRDLIAAAFDPQLFREGGRRLVDVLANHLDSVQAGSGRAMNWNDPEHNIHLAKARLDESNQFESLDRAALIERFVELAQQSLDHGLNLHHPHYVGHQVPASLPLAGLFDAITAITNQVMAIYEMGPWATAVEKAIIRELGEAIGFTPGEFGGLATSGGSLANLTALLAARNVALGDGWQAGFANRTPAPVIVAHSDAHYSITRAAGILGLGTGQVLRVPLDDHRRMNVAQLDAMLTDLRSRGIPVVAVCACACATPVGAFDQLEQVAEACRRHELWLHVDAAHGGAACLSENHRHLVQGLHLADSVVCDAHKMLFVPALCALVFFRNQVHRFCTFHQDAPYLFDPSDPGMANYDSGVVTVECTKRAATMGLWGVWSLFGKRLFAAMVDSTFALGKEFYRLLSDAEDFEPYCKPQCNIVVFRYRPSALQDATPARRSEFQLALRRRMVRSGEFYLVSTAIDGETCLRTTLINPLTTVEHLEALLNCLRRQGQELLAAKES